MTERYTVVKEFGGGKYRIGQVVACDQALDYDFWNYIQDKKRDGSVKKYVEPYENKAIIINKDREIKQIMTKEN